MKHQTMLVNENRLNLADQRARQYLARQMENFFFGGGAEQPAGYVPPTAPEDRSRYSGSPRGPRIQLESERDFDVATLKELLAQKEAIEHADRARQETGAQRRSRKGARPDGRVWPDGRRSHRQGRPRPRASRPQGRRQIPRCRHRRDLDRPRPAAEVAVGGARAASSSPTSRSDRPAAPTGRCGRPPCVRAGRRFVTTLRVIPGLRPRPAHPPRHRRDRRPLRHAEEGAGITSQGPVPVPRREVAELHRQPDAADLPLLRLRRARRRHPLPVRAPRHGLRRRRQRARAAGRHDRPGGHASPDEREQAARRQRQSDARPTCSRRPPSTTARSSRAPARHRLPEGPRPERRDRRALRPRLGARGLAHAGAASSRATTSRCSWRAAS